MKYMFLGLPDSTFPDLVQGKVYDLQVVEENKGLLGWIFGNKRPVIVHPFVCPYSSWFTFYQNWLKQHES